MLDDHLSNFLDVISKPALLEKSDKELLETIQDQNLKDILKKCLKSEIYRLFPYSSPRYSKTLVLVEIRESCKNLKTRLLY